MGGKSGNRTDELGEIRPGGGDCIHFYLNHSDFKRLLRFGIRQLGCPEKVQLSGKPKIRWDNSIIKKQRLQILEAFFDWEPNATLTGVLKALLVAGDSIGSAIANSNLKLDRWLCEKSITHILKTDDLERVIQARLGNNKLRKFQSKLGEIDSRVGLARAGCGTGKTVGAYNWAKRHAVGRKLFFCYPTTGTSTEGFLDYVQDEVESVLLHSRAAVDLELAKTGEEADAGDGIANEAEIKLQSFEAWESQVTICTVNTVLGLLQCHRRPMYCFPAIANAAFVFDEVHCYDKKLFGALLRFLETVKAPILLMSASFLPPQLRAIEDAVGEPVEIIFGPKELEQQPRYRFYYADEPDWGRVKTELEAGGKVLWVCNQVSTAIAVYDRAKDSGINALLYHSRYRYEDRVRHHRAVVDAFKPERTEPVLAIATQVAEMSLDLSATLLVSQIAEPPALIQRLGRLNRRYCGRSLDALFYPDPKDDRPYSRSQLDRGEAMIRELTGEVNQADLAQWLEQEENSLKPDLHSVLLDGEWRTYPAPLREAGVTVTALLEQDRQEFEKSGRSKLNLYAVPLLADSRAVKHWDRHKGYPIAPKDQFAYCRARGATAIKGAKGGDAK
ncbi:MAG: CRISPR-associated helicase Cas3' [Cyanobacteria bacterium J06641_5]